MVIDEYYFSVSFWVIDLIYRLEQWPEIFFLVSKGNQNAEFMTGRTFIEQFMLFGICGKFRTFIFRQALPCGPK
jgi:hypothetical protein